MITGQKWFCTCVLGAISTLLQEITIQTNGVMAGEAQVWVLIPVSFVFVLFFISFLLIHIITDFLLPFFA